MATTFLNPTKHIFGNDSFEQLPETLREFNPKKILLVLGSNSFRKSLYYNRLQSFLKESEFDESTAIPANPTESFLSDQWNLLRNKNYDLVIAIGGGSVLDFGKAIAAFLTQAEGTVSEYLNKEREFKTPPLPVIAIPTTAGTGSEVTPYSSISSDDKQKISLTHPYLFPKVAIVDPKLTYSMPSYLSACTGFDAICQAIESYWSRSNTETSQKHSLKAIPVLLKHIASVTQEPSHEEARGQMAYASSEAGMAIAETRTTAVHSVSYPK